MGFAAPCGRKTWSCGSDFQSQPASPLEEAVSDDLQNSFSG
jgi:hypothetical protein